jgi:hypothetical protein
MQSMYQSRMMLFLFDLITLTTLSAYLNVKCVDSTAGDFGDNQGGEPPASVPSARQAPEKISTGPCIPRDYETPP